MDGHITVLTVNWHSAELVGHLAANLTAKAAEPGKLEFLVVDNSGDPDLLTKLKRFAPGTAITVVTHNPEHLSGLHAHASALNAGFDQISSEYILTADPDIHLFRENWDSFMKQLLKEKNADAAGAPYPPWWLGTYHNFPSPVFTFAPADAMRKAETTWSPLSVTPLRELLNFVTRQILRGFFLFNRRALTAVPLMRKLTSLMEKHLPRCTMDTGSGFAQKAAHGIISAETFTAAYPDELQKIPEVRKEYIETAAELAKNYELYYYDRELILTHRYGSQNFLLKTEKGADTKHWLSLIEKMEYLQKTDTSASGEIII